MIVSQTKTPALPAKRMTKYRQRIWVPDRSFPGFAQKCRRQAPAVATSFPTGDEFIRFGASVYDFF
jgi:hypothetical protein